MKYAKARQGMEECFLTRGIELGMQLVLDSMIALGDICLYFSISKTLISDSLLFFFCLLYASNNSAYSYLYSIDETVGNIYIRLIFLAI